MIELLSYLNVKVGINVVASQDVFVMITVKLTISSFLIVNVHEMTTP